MRNANTVGPGTHLGRYRLVEKVGSGGMGDVYRATDTTLERTVAVKILPFETVATPDRRRRFETEAKSAATVSHPNLVPVFDYGESEGVLYIVQELVNGDTIAKILNDSGPIPPERAADWCAQAAEGLAGAHESGILHRDVKPGNVIVGRDGRVRVLDFGLAKMLSSPMRQLPGNESLTNDGFVVGSIHYMSPEQALGRDLDGRSDGFGLGIVFYEMLIGKRPFDRPSAVETMHAIAYDPPRPFEPTDPPVPAPLEAILDKALEKNPSERYQSLRELAIDLRRFVRKTSGSSSVLRPISASAGEPTVTISTTARRLSRRSRAVAVVAAAAALLLGAALVRRRLAIRVAEAQAPRATRYLVQTDSREEGPVLSPDGRAFAYAANGRGSYDIYYRLLAGGSPVRLTDSPEDEREAAFSRDGARVYFVRGDAHEGRTSIWSVPTLGGASRRILDDGDQPSLSPDGTRLLFRRWLGDKTSFFLADPDGANQRKLFMADTGELTGARFSPDGRFIAFLWREMFPGALGDLWRIPGGGGPPQRLTRDRRDVAGNVEWLPDGSAILFCSVRSGVGNIWMIEPEGGTPRPVTTGSGRVLSPSVSPDGTSLLVQTQRNLSDAWEYTLPGGEGHALTNLGGVWAPTRLRDGRLLYGDWSRLEEDLDLFVEDASGGRTLVGQGSGPRGAPDGKQIYCSLAAGEGRRVLAAIDLEGGPPRRLTEPVGSDDYADAAPDGSRVVFCRMLPNGKGGVMALPLQGKRAPTTLFEGDAMASRAGKDGAVFKSCARPEGCGVYGVPFAGGAPRLLVKEGRWPAFSSDGRTVYALTGPKSNPALVRVPFAGGTPETVFEFNPHRNPIFWAIFTLDLGPGDRSIVVTHQINDDDIAFLEGVFRR